MLYPPLLTNLNNRELTLATFIDFQKAFDTLDHTIIIKRLAELNMTPLTLKWFNSYLTNRSQVTTLNGITSNSAPIRTGVPQGSILGPLLFIIYVNNLPYAPKYSKILMYAHDTVLYMPISRNLPTDTLNKYQTDLIQIANWCFYNKLSINEKKTQIMILGDNSRSPAPPLHPKVLTLNDTPLARTLTYKYLGITLNSSLTLSEHVQTIIRTVHYKINTLSFLRRTVGPVTSLQIYKTTILPLMEYSNVIFSLINKRDRDKLQRLQNRALRIIYTPEISTEEAHSKAKLSTIQTRANTQLQCLMYRRSQNHPDYPLVTLFGPTRSSNKVRFVIPRPRSERFKMYPLYQGTILWDCLPAETQKVESNLAFKNRVKPRL